MLPRTLIKMSGDGKRVTQILGPSPDPKHRLFRLGRDSEDDESAVQQRSTPRPIAKVLPASSNRLSFAPPPQSRSAPPNKKLARVKTPTETHYHEFLSLDQAGRATIATSNTPDCNLVAIKRRKRTFDKALPNPLGVPCKNIVDLLDMSLEGDDIRMIYELMDVSLRTINSLPGRKWAPYEVAAICKEVLAGLAFIYDSGLWYGILDCGKVMLDREGNIKLADIGDCFLQDSRPNHDQERKDTQCVGFMVVELLESSTYLANSETIDLRHPEDWPEESGLQAFLQATQNTTVAKLAKHTFLDFSELRSCLKPYVFTALIAGSLDWDLV